MKLNKKRLIQIILFIAFLIVVTIAVVKLFPIIGEIATEEGRLAFREHVVDSGIRGFLTLFALQFSQIFLVVLPGEPIELLAGACYGSIGGTIFILASSMIISTIIIFFVKVFGKTFTDLFTDPEKFKRVKNSKLFKNPKKFEYIMFILFFIPGTPKDLLVYIGAMLPINKVRFVLLTTLARTPSVISSTIVGSNLIEGDIWLSIIIYASIFVVAVLVVLFLNIFDKDKPIKDILKIIK